MIASILHLRHKKGTLIASIAVCTSLCCAILIAPLAIDAQEERSGEVSTVVGKPFFFMVETKLENPRYQWSLSQLGRLIESQSSEFFRSVFSGPGDYELSLMIRGDGGDQERYSFAVRSERDLNIGANRTGELKALIRTVPPTDSAGVVRLPPQGGALRIAADESHGNILFYGIDVDTSRDTSADSVPDNDADNAFHRSYNTGEEWEIKVSPSEGEEERVIALTIGDRQGNRDATTVTVSFDASILLTPHLRTVPAMDPEMEKILIEGEGGVVRFNAEDSFGGVKQYALDLDSAFDSNGDGNSGNDNDVEGTTFVQDGSDIAIYLRPRQGERRVALHVSDAEGRVQTLERSIVFEGFTSSVPRGETMIVSTPEEIRVGEQFTLQVLSPPDGVVEYGWDLQSDGVEETQTTDPTLLLQPDAPGLLPIRVSMRGPLGALRQTLQEDFTVLDTGEVGANGTVPLTPTGEVAISASVKGLSASFEPKPSVPLNFQWLQPEWSFGDGAKSFLLHPNHTYEKPGTYTVSLILKSIEDGSVEARAQASLTATTITDTGEPIDEGGSALGGLVGVLGKILFAVLIFILVILFIVLLLGIPAFLYLSSQAKKEGVPLSEIVHRYVQKLPGASDSEKETHVIDAEVISGDSKKKNNEADIKEGKQVEEPMALVTDVDDESGSGENAESAPSWLSQDGATQVKADEGGKEESEVDDSPNKEGPVPAWLQTPGMKQQAAVSEKDSEAIETEEPPQPGDSVPDGGLDPSQVFGSSSEDESTKNIDDMSSDGPVPSWLASGAQAQASSPAPTPPTPTPKPSPAPTPPTPTPKPSPAPTPPTPTPKPSPTPTPKPSPAPTPPTPTPPPPVSQDTSGEEAHVPDWLKQGMQKAEGESVSIDTHQKVEEKKEVVSPPPQPGDSVPDDGLDPSQVFASSPSQEEKAGQSENSSSQEAPVPDWLKPQPSSVTQSTSSPPPPAPAPTPPPPPPAPAPTPPPPPPAPAPTPPPLPSEPAAMKEEAVMSDDGPIPAWLAKGASVSTPSSTDDSSSADQSLPVDSMPTQEVVKESDGSNPGEAKSELSLEERERRRIKRQRYRKNKREREKAEKAAKALPNDQTVEPMNSSDGDPVAFIAVEGVGEEAPTMPIQEIPEQPKDQGPIEPIPEKKE